MSYVKNVKCKIHQKEILLQVLRNHVDLCFPAISDYCDYDSSSTDNLPKVQILEKKSSNLSRSRAKSIA